MDRKKTILFIILVLTVILGIGAFWLLRDNNSTVKSVNTLKTLRGQAVDLVVQKTPAMIEKNLSKQDKARGQLWSLAQPKGSQQEFVIDANYEQGESLKKLTGYTKQPLRESVVLNVNIQLPKQYPEYEELTQRNLTVNGTEANETVFTYKTSGALVKQRLLLLFKNSETAIYIRAQAKADQYDKINEKYFEPIFSSAKFE